MNIASCAYRNEVNIASCAHRNEVDIEAFVSSLGLAKYAPLFAEHEVCNTAIVHEDSVMKAVSGA